MSPEAMAAGEMVCQWTKKRELTSKEWMKAVAMLIGWLQNGHLLHGSIIIVGETFSIAHVTMSQLLQRTCFACMTGLILSPETNSHKNKRGRLPKYFLTISMWW